VDVGGGEGQLLMRILELYPEMTGVVFDVAHGLGSARRTMGNAERCSYIAGNFFGAVPEGADAYVLCGVVHDWSDDLAVVILSNCRKAMARNSRALIVEMIVPKTNSASFSKLLDLNMMVMTAGRERTKSEFLALLDVADLRVTRIIPTMAPAERHRSRAQIGSQEIKCSCGCLTERTGPGNYCSTRASLFAPCRAAGRSDGTRTRGLQRERQAVNAAELHSRV
ncbi:MAG TPA: methyltransferase, partial [Terriglobales bacterium]|nr:methyltransferase [Terriglobales bacterium]